MKNPLNSRHLFCWAHRVGQLYLRNKSFFFYSFENIIARDICIFKILFQFFSFLISRSMIKIWYVIKCRIAKNKDDDLKNNKHKFVQKVVKKNILLISYHEVKQSKVGFNSGKHG